MTVIHSKRTSDEYELGVKYTCDACHSNITKVVRIKCAECEELEVDLCVECFSDGVDLNRSHLKTHAYKVIEPLNFPIFVPDWRADEELLLMDGIISLGLGNWIDVADFVGTKTAEECEHHYYQLFINSWSFPYPDKNLSIEGKFEVPTRTGPRIRRDTPFEVLSSQPANHEIAGYMPLRQEFEIEFENEAENAIKDLLFHDEDLSIDTELKLSVLHYYNDVLDKRAERKRFIIEHDLLDFKKHSAMDRQRTKEEKDMFTKVQPFERFLSLPDFNTFFEGLLEQKKLESRIEKLQEYRKNGIRDLKMGELYDKEKAQALAQSQLIATIEATKPAAKATPTGIATRSEFVSTSSTFKITAPPNVRRSLGSPLDITNSENVELLSNSEKNLCSILRLQPKLYLNIKDTLIAANGRLGYLKRAQARSLIKIDVNKTSRIYDFFVTAGWIKTSPSSRGSNTGSSKLEESEVLAAESGSRERSNSAIDNAKKSEVPLIIKLNLGRRNTEQL